MRANLVSSDGGSRSIIYRAPPGAAQNRPTGNLGTVGLAGIHFSERRLG
jgi:hypothetical protein